MRKIHFFIAIGLTSLFLAGCSQKAELLNEEQESGILKSASVAGKYIVVLKEDADIAKSDLQARTAKVKEKAFGLLKKYEVSGEIEEVYETALQGFTIRLAPGQEKKLAEDLNVKRIEADQIISLSPVIVKGKPASGSSPAQTIPWGITRVNGGVSGVGKTAWIIDTGIDLNHPDLTVDTKRSVTFLGSLTTPDDQNGHGTHVAGTIAAKNNSIGVIGVAAGATVVAVRVLNRQGSGTISGVISGVNYVANNGQSGDVANMSLGGGVSTSLDEAVKGAAAKVIFALAAGNESDLASNHSPARVEGANIYTIAAMDKGDIWAYYSNYGSPVNFIDPGSSITSTYKDGGYATMSGTSMATPHAAGVLLLGVYNTDGIVTRTGASDSYNILVH